MNREPNTSSKQARAMSAVIAALVTVVVLASIDGLSDHYVAEGQQACATPVVVAQR